MKTLIAVIALIIVIGCVSSGNVNGSSKKISESGNQSVLQGGKEPSKYSSRLPSTQVPGQSSRSIRAGSNNSDQTGPQSTNNELSVDLVLREEVVLTDAQKQRLAQRNNPADRSYPKNELNLNQTYTLQLAAFKTTEQATEYARKHHISAEHAGVARVLIKGNIWYVLAYGIFPTKFEADEAKKSLIAKGVPEPWMRPLATLERLAEAASQVSPQ